MLRFRRSREVLAVLELDANETPGTQPWAYALVWLVIWL